MIRKVLVAGAVLAATLTASAAPATAIEPWSETTLWERFGTPTGWQTHLAGDFNGDGRDDVASFHPSNATWWVSISNGKQFTTHKWADFTTTDGWTSHVAGDFNGDGRDDVASFNVGNATWWVSISNGKGFDTRLWDDFTTTNGWTSHLAGDFNGDGRTDIANYNETNGTWWVSTSTGGQFATTMWAGFGTATGWAEHLTGDFNGDGRYDIANFHSSNATWWVSISTGSAFTTTLWADFTIEDDWQLHIVGDFDGDGRDGIISWHNPSQPPRGLDAWFMSTPEGAGFRTEWWGGGYTTVDGWTGHVVLAGFRGDELFDYNSDLGRWWRHNDALWELFDTRSGWTAHLAGDFDGDGRDDIANYHGGAGTWWVTRSLPPTPADVEGIPSGP